MHFHLPHQEKIVSENPRRNWSERTLVLLLHRHFHFIVFAEIGGIFDHAFILLLVAFGLGLFTLGFLHGGHDLRREIGYVTSGSPAPFLKKNIALAYVPPAHAEIGHEVFVEIRGQKIKCKVVPTPFYKRPKKA